MVMDLSSKEMAEHVTLWFFTFSNGADNEDK